LEALVLVEATLWFKEVMVPQMPEELSWSSLEYPKLLLVVTLVS
jgi:hypothetical protein